MMQSIVVDDDALSRKVIKEMVQQTDFLTLHTDCKDALEATNVLKQAAIDLIFLDIEMPKISGLEFIKSVEIQPQVILTTSHKEYALEAFNYDVTDYLVKPINNARFLKAVNKAKKLHDQFHQSEKQGNQEAVENIFVKHEGAIVKIKVADINLIKAEGDYVTIETDKKSYLIHSTMKKITKKLSSSSFIRVHRSYIVNTDKIKSLEDNILAVKDKLIPVGKSYRSELMDHLNLI